MNFVGDQIKRVGITDVSLTLEAPVSTVFWIVLIALKVPSSCPVSWVIRGRLVNEKLTVSVLSCWVLVFVIFHPPDIRSIWSDHKIPSSNPGTHFIVSIEFKSLQKLIFRCRKNSLVLDSCCLSGLRVSEEAAGIVKNWKEFVFYSLELLEAHGVGRDVVFSHFEVLKLLFEGHGVVLIDCVLVVIEPACQVCSRPVSLTAVVAKPTARAEPTESTENRPNDRSRTSPSVTSIPVAWMIPWRVTARSETAWAARPASPSLAIRCNKQQTYNDEEGW